MAHLGEALYVRHHHYIPTTSTTTINNTTTATSTRYGVKRAVGLRLSFGVVLLWFVAVFLTGMPMLRHLRKMIDSGKNSGNDSGKGE